MDRCALFVDASYVLADGAMAVHGTRQRESVSWDYAGLVKLLSGLSRDRTGLPVLRCYWYEATVEGRRSSEHNALADLPGAKLRLGRVRPGRREGVEAEMHRDLTTLARNHAVSDAVIVSAEEDLTEVVAEVQDLGLRVVIVHIAAEGNWTPPRPLRQESDDIVEVTGAHLRPFVDLIPAAEPSDADEQYRNGNHQRRSLTNGHGNGIGAVTHQGLPAAALPPAPTMYASPVAEDYQRTPAGASQPAAGQAPAPDAQPPTQAPQQSAAAAQPQAPAAQPPQAPGSQGSAPALPAAPAAQPPAQVPAPPVAAQAPAPPQAAAAPPDAVAPARAQAPTGSPDQVDPQPQGPSQPGPPAHPQLPAQPAAVAHALASQAQDPRQAQVPGGEQPMAQAAPQAQAPAVAQPVTQAPAPAPQVLDQAQTQAQAQTSGPAHAQQQAQSQAQPQALAPSQGLAPSQLPAPPAQAPQSLGPQDQPAPQHLAASTPPPGYGPPPGAQWPAEVGPNPVRQGSHGPHMAPQPGQGTARFGPSSGDYRSPNQAGSAQGRFGELPAPQRYDGQGQSRYADNGTARFAEGPQSSRFAEGPAQGRYGDASGPGQYPPAPPSAYGGAGQMPYPPQYPALQPGQHAASGPAPGYPPQQQEQGPYSGPQSAAHAALPAPVQPMAMSLADAVQAAHAEGFGFGDAVARDAPALWLEAVLARKPRMPSDLEARLLQGSALPIDSLLHDEVRHSLRRGFWDALERSRR